MTESNEFIGIALLVVSGLFFLIGIVNTIGGMGNPAASGGKQFITGLVSLGLSFLFLSQAFLVDPKLKASVLPVMEKTSGGIQANPFSDGSPAESEGVISMDLEHGSLKENLLFFALMIAAGVFLAPFFSRGMILSLVVISGILSLYLLRKNADVTYTIYSLNMAGFTLGFLLRRRG